jgi:hypothetical protein
MHSMSIWATMVGIQGDFVVGGGHDVTEGWQKRMRLGKNGNQ